MMKNCLLAIALFFLSACALVKSSTADYTIPSTTEAGNQQGFVDTIVAQTLTAMQPTPTSTSIPTQTPTEPPLANCEGSFFGIQITLPNNTWTCTIQPVNDNSGVIFDEVITLKSNLYIIDISDLGRDAYCWNEPDQSGCVVTEFYKNGLMTLDTYSIDGKLGEIFGLIAHRAWISIKYQGMESHELTETEKQELIQLVDSIKFTASTPSECEGMYTGIRVTMPNVSWMCKVAPDIQNGIARDEAFYIVSPLFEVTMSYVGRGYGCEEIKFDPNSTCEVVEFYRNPHMTIQKYVVDGKNSQIFGVTDKTMIVDGGEARVWISIRYDSMGERELHSVEMQELTQLLDSITFSK